MIHRTHTNPNRDATAFFLGFSVTFAWLFLFCRDPYTLEQGQSGQSSGTSRHKLTTPMDAETVSIANLTRQPGYLREPVDPHDYSYIHDARDACLDANGHPANVSIVFLTLSAPVNFLRRDAVRQTYGNASSWFCTNTKVRNVFLLGTTPDVLLQTRIDMEAESYGDIIQEDFIDSYWNLTKKTIMGLKWATSNCRQAEFTMKIDDDTMMNQARLVEHLRVASRGNFVLSKAWINHKVVRDSSSKFYMSKEYYPSHTFPNYMDGPGYVMSSDVVERVYHVAMTTPLFPLEDVFIGMCLEKLGVPVNNTPTFLCNRIRKGTSKEEAEAKVRCHTLVSNLGPAGMLWVWDVGRLNNGTSTYRQVRTRRSLTP